MLTIFLPFDNAGNLTGYDNVGNRTFMQRAHTSGAPADVYQYDNLYQLTQVWYGADAADPDDLTAYEQHQSYDLDPPGNWLVRDENGATTTYQPHNGQRLTNSMNRYEQVDGADFEYDDAGNLLTDGRNSYIYDALNRQISVNGLDSSTEYVYDALGRRVAKTVDGVATYYVYNAGYQVIEEWNGKNELLARYTYGSGIDEPLTMERGGQTYYYHRDGLGSITEITDATGNLVERYEYDVYGAPTIFDSTDTELTASAIENPYLFTGRRYDPESGNYYYRARMYSPTLGRFLQMDPLGYTDGLNLYVYVGNNPVNFIDSFGLATIVLDPGHGVNKHKIQKDGTLKELGFDTGARKPPNSQNPISTEHDMALELAKALKPRLEELGHKVVLTREGPLDVEPSLEELEWRLKIVKQENADYVLSIHLNSFSASAKNRILLYYLETSNEGKILATHITDSITDEEFEICEPVSSPRGEKQGENRHPDDYEPGSWRIVWKHESVGLLLEAGNLQDPHTEGIIMGEEFITQVVQGIHEGITDIENSKTP